VVDRNYSKDPVLIRDNKKLYGVIIAIVVVFLCLQIGMRLFSGKHKTNESVQNLVEDKGRTVFKENDIAKGLEAFGKGAKESALKKLQAKNEKHTFRESENKPERLSPVSIIHHETGHAAWRANLRQVHAP